MDGKLIKLSSVHDGLRTDEIIGEFPRYPMEGENFFFLAEALDPDLKETGVRFIETTPVLTSEQTGNFIIFSTKNSTYKLEVYG